MRSLRDVAVVVVASLAAGVALSFGQGAAPDGIAPLANSALPVVTLAAGAALAGRRLWANVLLAASAGPLAMVGYYATSVLRGYGASSSWVALWIGAGVVAGSVMGAAVWAIRQPMQEPPAMWLRGLAVGYWPGIAIGEAAHGLTRIADSTPSAYWWGQVVVAIAVLVGFGATRLTSWTARLCAVASASAVGTALYVAYGLR